MLIFIFGLSERVERANRLTGVFVRDHHRSVLIVNGSDRRELVLCNNDMLARHLKECKDELVIQRLTRHLSTFTSSVVIIQSSIAPHCWDTDLLLYLVRLE